MYAIEHNYVSKCTYEFLSFTATIRIAQIIILAIGALVVIIMSSRLKQPFHVYKLN